MSSSKKQKKSVLLRVAVLAFAIYMIASLTSLWVELVSVNKELKAYEQELEEKTLKVSELSRLLENGTEAELIEKAARERLGFVYADEQVYIDISGN